MKGLAWVEDERDGRMALRLEVEPTVMLDDSEKVVGRIRFSAGGGSARGGETMNS